MELNRKIIYITGFIFSIPIALTSYINSSFLEIYTNPYYISIIYMTASVFTILGLLEMPRTLAQRGNRHTAFLFCMVSFFSLITMAFASNAYAIIPAFILFFVSTGFVFASLDIFIEDFSKHSSIGKFRGFYLTVINLAWVLSQLTSGYIIDKSSYVGIYIISAVFMLLTAVIFTLTLKTFQDPEYKKLSLKKTIQIFTKDKRISKIYILNFILKFFYAWMVIYTPIYLHQYLHLGWNKIGIIFTFMLLPFVILSFPLGKLSDKIGEKKMLKIGFLITAFSTLLIPFIHAPKVWLLALILFSTRVGAATVEVMSESYFFKLVNEENVDAITFFRNTNPIAYIIAPLLAVPILYLVPSFKYLFFVLGAIMFVGYFITLKLRDVK